LIEESYPIVTEGARLAGLPVVFAATMEMPEVVDVAQSADAARSAGVASNLAGYDDRTVAALPVLNLVRSIHYPTDH